MKLIHLSDLHIGKRVNEYSMLEDQEYILDQILGIIDDEKPDAVLIAGDVYDKSVPPAEATTLFDDFIVKLSRRELAVFIISGNHDSAERLAFGRRLMDPAGIHFSGIYDGKVEPYTMTDEQGIVDIYMLPFIKPVHARVYLNDESVKTYNEAVVRAIEAMNINTDRRNILITHQFVTGAERSESETVSVGGTDNVDACIFDAFDYVALGHLHRPQNVGSDRVRYSGTPLKYSFSEENDLKSVTVIELGNKNDLAIRTVDLKPLRDMVTLKGTFSELMDKSTYENTSYTSDYVRLILTDEEDVPEAIQRARKVYSNIMKLEYDNTRTRLQAAELGTASSTEKTPIELMAELYEKETGTAMTEEQSEFVIRILESLGEGR